MCAESQRCGPNGQCFGSIPTLGCESLGSRCLGCGVGRLAGWPNAQPAHGYLVRNEHGEFAGWLIKDGGATELQPFDIVVEVNGLAPDESFFEKLDALTSALAKFVVTAYRDGKRITITHERV